MTVPAQPVSLGTPPEFGLLQHYASVSAKPSKFTLNASFMLI